MESKSLILVVEDDRPIRNFICVSLETEGYHYIETHTGKSAISLIASHNPDVVILDLGLPDIDGLEVIKKVRDWFRAKIIVVSARGQEREKVEALDAGADDFLTKPFSIGELMARIRVALRHVESSRSTDGTSAQEFKVGGLEIDYVKRRVYVDCQEVHLTPIEYNILTLMSQNAGKVLTHNFILKKIWGSFSENDTKSLRVFMASIRRKLEKEPAQPRYILTEVGVGYRLAEE
ncbi:MAG: DNA-binding response regulator [Clostridia bacterium]|jgi:two-component system KDP operon response regulator KdpE|nr:DNA-binding response regulator [Clostridia bacterium]